MPATTTVIETPRLILRPFHPVDDVADFQRIYGDPLTMAHMNGAKTPEAARLSVERKAAKWATQGYGLWCVVDKAGGQTIGHCGLDLLEPLGEVECAYLIDRPFWGQGLATEAVKASIAFGFERLGLTRIIAISEPENPASMAVMAKAGMVQEGPVTVWGRPFICWVITLGAESPP
ncbi:MAG: N-acetyltransferase [Magnetospirillum sp.]|nr:MAG: N-acetyltransferase [Magnetospirillum sp.]